MTTEENDEVARLVRLAGGTRVPYDMHGPIAPLDEARLARVRTAVHGAWRDELVARQSKTRRRWLAVTVLLAAAASVVIAFALWRPTRTPDPIRPPAPVLVAHIDQITGRATGSPAPYVSFGAGGAVMSGSTVTTSGGTLAMTLTSGVHLRMDASSSVRMDSATDVALERGAVYVDSARAHPVGSLSPGTPAPRLPGASPISIHTPAGLVRDIGTQFDVRLADGGMRIRVRDGEVRVTYANGVDARAGAGEALFSKPDGSIDRRPVAATGNTWAWAERAAPTFSVGGKTLGEFLDWVSREGAWTVTFADSRSSKAARAIVLDGRPDLLKGLTAAEALDVVLPTCGLRHRIDRHRVVIERVTSR
jgi:ferric-dicitrate binding protein FerR (iron transport regulator)